MLYIIIVVCTYCCPIVYYCILEQLALLQVADADGSGSLSFEEFAALFKELSHRPEIEVLFTKYASSHDYMTPADLRMFSMGEQSACPTLEDCQKLVEVYEPTDEGKASGRMSLDGEQEDNSTLNFPKCNGYNGIVHSDFLCITVTHSLVQVSPTISWVMREM